MALLLTPLELLPEVFIVTPQLFEDERGSFRETYKRSTFLQAGITADYCQDNHSVSAKGVIRGLHYQVAPQAQSKLVRVSVGAIWDVVVDVREHSPTYLKWCGVVLSAQNGEMLAIPEGFAHGFLSLEEGTEVQYKCSAEYTPLCERGLRWNDPQLNITWPTLAGVSYTISSKDSQLPFLNQ